MERARASLGGRPALVRLCLAVTAAALALTGLIVLLAALHPASFWAGADFRRRT